MEAYIYARVSSKDQEREGYSIPAQLELLRDYAFRQGFTVVGEYSEAETAKSAGRTQFNQMVGELKQRKTPAVLLVEKTDRLYRNLKDYITIEELMSQDIAVHKVKEGVILHKNAHSSEKFMDGIKVLMAKQYIDNLSEEVKKGRKQKVLQGGWHTRAPFGYKNDKNTRSIIPDPEKAPLVIRAYQLYATGLYSLDVITEKLYQEGFRYQPATPRITRSRLHEILRSPAYIGQIPFNGEVYPGSHPGIIDNDTWRAVQLAFRKDNKPVSLSKKDFLYRGLITCGECGAAVVGELKKGKYVYYRCASKKQGCSQGYAGEKIIDEAVSSVFRSLQFPDDFGDLLHKTVQEIHLAMEATEKEEHAAVQAKMEKVRRKRRTVYEDRIAGVIDANLWMEIDRDTAEELKALEEQQSRINHADDDYKMLVELALQLPKLFQGAWSDSDGEEKKELLSFTLSNLILLDGNALPELKEHWSALRKLPSLSRSRSFQDEVRTFLLLHSRNIRQVYKALSA